MEIKEKIDELLKMIHDDIMNDTNVSYTSNDHPAYMGEIKYDIEDYIGVIISISDSAQDKHFVCVHGFNYISNKLSKLFTKEDIEILQNRAFNNRIAELKDAISNREKEIEDLKRELESYKKDF